MRSNSVLALAASLSTASAYYTGFNYGSTQTDGSYKDKSAFADEFEAAKGLVGTNSEFTSARLYTMIQGGTTSDPIEAISAAVDSGTKLLLGLWASAGETDFANELAALSTAISTYGDDFTSLVIGISVGSEDLYRNSVMGVESDAGVGVDPDVIVDYISQLRDAISGTGLSSVPVGHVDTWTAWVNSSNTAVIDAVDWLGFDGYPYFQNTMSNPISAGKTLFYDAVDQTVAVADGKDVWITETGWPVSGDTENEAVASIANAKTYWDDVACSTIGNMNVFWYTLQDSYPTTPNPSFGLVGSTLSTTPLYNLTCPEGSNTTEVSSSSSASGSSASKTGSAASSATASVIVTSATATITGTLSGTPFTSTLVATSTLAASNATVTGSSNSTGSSGSSSSGSDPSGSTTSSGSSSSSSTTPSSGASSLSASFLGGAGALIALLAFL